MQWSAVPTSIAIVADDQLPPPDSDNLREARQLAWLLDDAVRLPWGFRFGVDALLGLVPVVGDALGLLASLRIVAIARRSGIPTSLLARMLGNIAGDALIGIVPLAGDLFDFGFKANARNVALLEAYLEDRARARRENGHAGAPDTLEA